MRDTKTRKVKLNIKGKMRNRVHKYFSHKKAKKHALQMHTINYKNNDFVEVLIEGNREDVWAMVNWHKRGPILCTVSEVDVEFID